MIEVASGTKCDFCSKDATWEFPARTFKVEMLSGLPLDVNSIEAWLSCDACHDLIERGDWRGLAERSIRVLGFQIPTEIVMGLHQEFRNNWIGPARKVK